MAGVYYSANKCTTEVVFDHSIDQTSEGRTFANESGDNDLVHVDGPNNPFHRRRLVDYILSRSLMASPPTSSRHRSAKGRILIVDPFSIRAIATST
ncbi:hypothetical protein RHGRI_007800 [Rhododendron griersonianum]|uniref:Uncharacterized protein n=1 Tax=Rhododendron griersonianum TaxID=479676 RepID=A0AAV6KZ02_9ERIC|nr:hypothetical protein RHGRI_007800 [Rhododendron griersonianum]